MTDARDSLRAALADRYAIERELGAGGMATVYLAEDLKLHRKVALKVLRPELASALGPDRFLQEIDIAAKLTHPHILGLHDCGEADGFLYYVMPHIEGESLRDKLAKEGELPIGEAVRILRDVVDALSHAHKHNVVHRDIKPDNVLLSERHALVTDFGVAKAVSEATGAQKLTTEGVALGTPAYMSPEQAAADKHIDHRADIYAVGAVAYELLTGRPPFLGTTPQEVLASHVTKAVEPVTEHRGTVPPALAQLVMRCLEKKPADRWQTAEELLPQLEALATPSGGVTPTGTMPVGAVQALRNNTLLAAGAVLGAVVVALAGWWLLAGRTGTSAVQTSERISVAVMVFENPAASDDDEYLNEAIADDINTQLMKIGGLGVKAHASARRLSLDDVSYAEIGERLGAEYLVHGNWRRVGDSVRVTSRLIVPDTEEQLWADRYDREWNASDMLGIASSIAQDVADALNVTVGPEEAVRLAAEPTENTEAYVAYQRGRFFRSQRTEESLRRAIDYFNEAVEADSDFALAYAGLADAYFLLTWNGSTPPTDMFDSAGANINRALGIDSTLGEAHTVLAAVTGQSEWDIQGSEEAYKRAIALSPDYATAHHWYCLHLGWMDRVDEAVAECRRALELDPLSVQINKNTGEILLEGSAVEEATEQLRRALEIDSTAGAAHLGLGDMFVDRGMYQRGLAEYEQVYDIDGAWGRIRAHALMGDHDLAMQVFDSVRAESERKWVSPTRMAQGALVLGDTSLTYELLTQAVEERDPRLLPRVLNWFLADTTNLGEDPRLRRLLNSMGLDVVGDRIVQLERGRGQ